MITHTELCLLMRSAENVDGIADLLRRGLVRPLLDGDRIVALDATDQGNATLSALTMPTGEA
jgi:hypothetical protein